MRENSYCIYDSKDNDLLVGVFDSTQAAKFLGLTKGSFYSAISHKVLAGNRYNIIVERCKKNETEKEKNKWR